MDEIYIFTVTAWHHLGMTNRVAARLARRPNIEGTSAPLQASDAEVVQEPTDQPYGVRDCAFCDPAAA